MGSIAKALSRAGYLRPVVDSLNELIQRRKYEQGLQQLAEMLSGSENRIEDIYTGTKEEKTVTPTGRTTYPALGQLVGQDPVQRPETLLSSLANTQPKPLMRLNPVTKNYEEEKVVGVPETITETKQIPRYTPQEQNKLAGQEINSFLRRLITSQDIPMERGQVGLSALQQLANTYQPQKKNLKGINRTDDVYDDYGNLIKKGEPRETKGQNISKYETDAEGRDVIRTIGGQNYRRLITYDANGNKIGEKDERIPGSGEGKTTVNVNTNDYNYSHLYSNLQEGIKQTKILKDTKLTKRSDGRLEFFPPGKSNSLVFDNQDEFDAYKEENKKKYVNDAYELMLQRGLDSPEDNNTAIKNIREQINKGYTLEEAITEFKKANPDFSPKDLKMMKEYFELSMM